LTKNTKINPRSRRLAFNSFLSLVGRGGSQVSNTAILLLVAYWRGAADAGIYSLATRYVSLCLGFSSLGLDTLLIRDVSQRPQQARNYAKNLGILRLFSSTLTCVCLALFVSQFPNYAPDTARIVILFTFSLIPESLSRLCQSSLVALDDYTPLAKIGIIRTVLGLPLGVGALWLGANLETIVLLQLAISWLALAFAFAALRMRLKSVQSVHDADEVDNFNWRGLKRWLRASASFAAIESILTLEWQLDIVLLSFFANEQQVGLYGVAQAILSILMLLLYSADMVILPLTSRAIVKGRLHAGRVIRRLIIAIAILTIPFAFLLSLAFALIFPWLLGDEFAPVLVPLYWLIATWVIHFVNAPGARLIISLGWQRLVAGFAALGVGLNTALCVLLIPSQGIRAPALARAVSVTAYALFCTGTVLWLFAKRQEMWKAQKRPFAPQKTTGW
jgi:O-antigen/teichoic acid export membrane protein